MSSRAAKALDVFINDAKIGLLSEINGLWSFEYTEAWLKNPHRFALSPHLPLSEVPLLDGASLRQVQWYFDNLLPEEGERVLLASDANLDAADAFGMLTAYGAESAGSLTLLPTEPSDNQAAGLRILTEEELQERIHRLPKAPLSKNSPKRMSLAGAQHKLAVVLDENGILYEPAGATVSTHILKPDHTDSDYPHSVVNEWFVMRLAKALGLNVPRVHRLYVPAPVYLIDRFDRTPGATGSERLHAIDACQLLGLDRSYKYSQGSLDALEQIAQACRSPAVVKTKLFSWLAFNMLTGNSDAHLKNLSFLVSHEGVELAPFYDLLCIGAYDTLAFNRSGWPQKTTLAWPLPKASCFADIDRNALLSAGQALGLPKTVAERLIDALRNRIVGVAEDLYRDFESENAILIENRPELGAKLAGEARCLRTIIHNVIRELVRRTK